MYTLSNSSELWILKNIQTFKCEKILKYPKNKIKPHNQNNK